MRTSFEETSSRDESAGIGIVWAISASVVLELLVIFSVQSTALVVLIVLQANTDSTIREVPEGTAAKISVSELEVSLALAFAKVSAISGLQSV